MLHIWLGGKAMAPISTSIHVVINVQHEAAVSIVNVDDYDVPFTVNIAESEEGLLLKTLHLYFPGCLPVTVRLWVYRPATASFRKLLVSP